MGNSKIARENLAKQIKNGAVILHSGNIVYRNNDTWYPFRQDSNFYYLTEWPEPDAHACDQRSLKHESQRNRYHRS